MLKAKKTPAPATLGKGVSVGESKRTWSQTTSTFAEMEDFAAVKSGGLTKGKVSGNVRAEAENLQQKARRSLDTGIFYAVHAPEKHGESTAIHGREWANRIPFGEICPPFCCGFRLPAFFASCVRPKNEKTTEVTSCLN